MTSVALDPETSVIGRYLLHSEVARGGMATIYLGRMLGQVGFSRRVAIKRLHPHYAREPDFLTMFFDEAQLAARISHPNVVAVLDIVTAKGELLIVMDYVHGLSLARLRRELGSNGHVPCPIAARIIIDALHGLGAAHDAQDASGKPLAIVHRDISPQNVLVGADGVSRITDFGIATAARRLAHSSGQLKGKLAYMAPEQLRGEPATRRVDLYAAGVVFWEAITGRRWFTAPDDAVIVSGILEGKVPPPSTVDPALAPYDTVLLKALSLEPQERFASAREMADAIEACGRVASIGEVADWVRRIGGEPLAEQQHAIEQMESGSDNGALDAKGLASALASGSIAPPRSTPPVADGDTSLEVSTDALLKPRGGSVKTAIVGVSLLVLGVTVGAVAVYSSASRGRASPPQASSAATTVAAPRASATAPLVASSELRPAAPSAALPSPPARFSEDASAKGGSPDQTTPQTKAGRATSRPPTMRPSRPAAPTAAQAPSPASSSSARPRPKVDPLDRRD